MTQTQEIQQKAVLTAAHDDYANELIQYSLSKVRDCDLGKDLVQDTFMKTWRYLVRGREIDKMRAFLYHVLNHLIIDEYRKHKMTSLDILLEKGFEPNVATSSCLLNFIDEKTALPLINKLPEKYRKVLHLRYVQDLSLTEISLITGQTKNTLAVQAHRGLKMLKILYNSG